jgi:hypothetical protein
MICIRLWIWGEDELIETLRAMVSHIGFRFNNHSKIVVQDLGDFVDGWDGETTRKWS